MKTISKRAVFAEIHQDIREGGQPHEFSIDYVKKDGTLGHKERVSKTAQRLPGQRGYRGHVNLNHVLLLQNRATGQVFEVLIDLLTHYNGIRINHTY
ncbi:hypothetical protein ACS5NO_12835 [Larkinella sp. GY13]|uniref:hypothetical protein n=1 Tax=Larkinella sp. GY13 TaxID=3453720 RepID=UPI003EEB2675